MLRELQENLRRAARGVQVLEEVVAAAPAAAAELVSVGSAGLDALAIAAQPHIAALREGFLAAKDSCTKR